MSSVRNGERRVFDVPKFEVKIVLVDEDVGWQPGIELTLKVGDEAEEFIWALDVPDALYLSSMLRVDAREVAKQQNKMAEFAAMEAIAKTETQRLRTPVGCSVCSKPVAVIDEDGIRYCKRHAEAAGIRPHGKIA